MTHRKRKVGMLLLVRKMGLFNLKLNIHMKMAYLEDLTLEVRMAY